MLDHAQLLGIVLCTLAIPFTFQTFSPSVPCIGNECWASDGTEPTPSPEKMKQINADINRNMSRVTMACAVVAASFAAAGVMAFRHSAPATVATLAAVGGVASFVGMQ